MSNTEPLVRLNIETRSNKDMLKAKTKELLEILADA
jgi:phosphomannomutase/phosphomannomutase/phosphoglucomutase